MSRKPAIASSKSTAGNAAINTRVKVAVRCRPAFQDEIEFANNEFFSIVEMKKDAAAHNGQQLGQLSLTTISGKQRDFFFDHVFADDVMQDVVYDRLARPVVNEVLKGCNGTIFAYGQTGTGKTYTMGILEFVHDEHAGLIPRAIFQIFEYVQQARKQDDEVNVSLSFLQLYRENIQDLLAPAAASGGAEENLAIREDPVRGFYVEGLQVFAVRNYREAEALINLGLENRAIAPTLMNSTSSRSHTVLTIHIEQRVSSNSTSSYSKTLRSKLLMVDLAGSERVRRTVSKGTRLSEAKSINTSLSALGNVIAALAEHTVTHVPYRDSKLTRLLQDSLGGNAATALIATIGPAAVNYGETLSTLLFAQRCMAVKITPVPHEEIDYAEMCAKLQSQINAMEGKMTEKLLEQQNAFEQTIENLNRELESEREHSQQAQFLNATRNADNADGALSVSFQKELETVLETLSLWQSDETSMIEESWLRQPLGFSLAHAEKRLQTPNGQLVSVISYSFELIKFLAIELNKLLVQNLEREEECKEELAEAFERAAEEESERDWERSHMALYDPRRQSALSFGGHLAPLSKVDAMRRVEAQARSNNAPVGAWDRQNVQPDPSLRVSQRWEVRESYKARGRTDRDRDSQRDRDEDDLSTEDDQRTSVRGRQPQSQRRSRSARGTAHTSQTQTQTHTVRTAEGDLPLLPSVCQYQSLEEVVQALHSLRQRISVSVSSLRTLLVRKDAHYRGVKEELAAQMVEKRRREEEVVNWSFILKYLLASATKLRQQLHDVSADTHTHTPAQAFAHTQSPSLPVGAALRSAARKLSHVSVRGRASVYDDDEEEDNEHYDDEEEDYPFPEEDEEDVDDDKSLFSAAPPPPPPSLSHSRTHSHARSREYAQSSAAASHKSQQPSTRDPSPSALHRLFNGRDVERDRESSPGQSVATAAQRVASSNVVRVRERDRERDKSAQRDRDRDRERDRDRGRESEGEEGGLRGVSSSMRVNTTNVSVSSLRHSHSRDRERSGEREHQRERDYDDREERGSRGHRDRNRGRDRERDFGEDSEYSLTSTTRSFRSAATPNSIPVPHYRRSRSKQRERDEERDTEEERERDRDPQRGRERDSHAHEEADSAAGTDREKEQQFFRTQRSASIDSTHSLGSTHSNTRVIARREIKDLRRSRSQSLSHSVSQAQVQSQSQAHMRSRSPSPSQAMSMPSSSSAMPRERERDEERDTQRGRSRSRDRDRDSSVNTFPSSNTDGATLSREGIAMRDPKRSRERDGEREKQEKAPSAFAQEVVRSLGVQGEQARAAMTVIDRVSSITPAQLAALDNETRQQILQIRKDLGIDAFLSKQQQQQGGGGNGNTNTINNNPGNSISNGNNAMMSTAEQRRQLAEQTHYQRVNAVRASSATRSTVETSPSRAARSVTPTSGSRGRSSSRGRERDLSRSKSSLSRSPHTAASSPEAYNGNNNYNNYSDAASLHSKASIPISAITQSSFGSMPAHRNRQHRHTYENTANANDYHHNYHSGTHHTAHANTHLISPMTAGSAFSEMSFAPPPPPLHSVSPNDRQRWQELATRSRSPQRVPANTHSHTRAQRRGAGEEDYSSSRRHHHSRHTDYDDDEDDDDYSQIDFMN